MSQENDSGNGVEDPMNFGIFSNSGLWEMIFKEKAYDIKKDQKGKVWIVTIPAAKIRDALLEDQKKVITVFNDLYESHECYQGLIANKKVTDITSDAGLTGNLIFEIDSKTKLIRSIEIPDLQLFEVQYSGTICDKPDEKVTGFYDIASNESVKYIVDEIEENKAVRKKSKFWDELIFAFGHVEL